ncbi:MAG: aminotransferase, partial [Lautropia mirabilis]|nr:aminotransferase [Lautropia mirabilis]
MPLHDFSTNANAAGPCPAVLHRLQQLVPDTYPDPAYASLRTHLA